MTTAAPHPSSPNPLDVSIYGSTEDKDVSVAPPKPTLETPNDIMVHRSYGFLDMCDFSKFTAEHGPPDAFEALRNFRSLVRIIGSARGIRIARWMGDGAMLVGIKTAPLAAAMVEISARSTFNLRGGLSEGPSLLFEGDDHIGESVNLASRLCDHAAPNQILIPTNNTSNIPQWIEKKSVGTANIKGLPKEPISALSISSDLKNTLQDHSTILPPSHIDIFGETFLQSLPVKILKPPKLSDITRTIRSAAEELF